MTTATNYCSTKQEPFGAKALSYQLHQTQHSPRVYSEWAAKILSQEVD